MPRQSSHPLSHSFTIVIFAHPLDVAKVQLSLAFLYLSAVLSEPCLFTSCPIALFSLLFSKRNKRSILCPSPIGTHLSMETIENLPVNYWKRITSGPIYISRNIPRDLSIQIETVRTIDEIQLAEETVACVVTHGNIPSGTRRGKIFTILTPLTFDQCTDWWNVWFADTSLILREGGFLSNFNLVLIHNEEIIFLNILLSILSVIYALYDCIRLYAVRSCTISKRLKLFVSALETCTFCGPYHVYHPKV